MAKDISKKETTAVEWLVKELNLEGYDATVSEALAMEKEQIIDAYGQGYINAQNYEEIGIEQYYKETYGS